MVINQILAEIDSTIAEVRRKPTSREEAARLYERLGRKVAGLHGNSIAYRKFERRKGARIRQELEEIRDGRSRQEDI